jgi:hypothetical protein
MKFVITCYRSRDVDDQKFFVRTVNIKNIEGEIKVKSAQLLPAQYSEPVTPERSPLMKQFWRKNDQSTPLEDQSLPASSTDQSMATTSTPWE